MQTAPMCGEDDGRESDAEAGEDDVKAECSAEIAARGDDGGRGDRGGSSGRDDDHRPRGVERHASSTQRVCSREKRRETTGGDAVMEAFLVVLFGAGLMALGTVESTMYDIAVVVILVGLIGILIRAVEW